MAIATKHRAATASLHSYQLELRRRISSLRLTTKPADALAEKSTLNCIPNHTK